MEVLSESSSLDSQLCSDLKTVGCPFVREMSHRMAVEILYSERNFTRLLILQWLFNEILSSSSCKKCESDKEDVILRDLADVAVTLGLLPQGTAVTTLSGAASKEEQTALWHRLITTVQVLKCHGDSSSVDSSNSSSTTLTSTSSTSSASPTLKLNIRECQKDLRLLLTNTEMKDYLQLPASSRITNNAKSKNPQTRSLAFAVEDFGKRHLTSDEEESAVPAGASKRVNDDDGVSDLLVELEQQLYAFNIAFNLHLDDICTTEDKKAEDENGFGEKYHEIRVKIDILKTYAANRRDINRKQHELQGIQM